MHGGPSNSKIEHLQSHGKNGDCEQSKLTAKQRRVPVNIAQRSECYYRRLLSIFVGRYNEKGAGKRFPRSDMGFSN